MVREPELPGDDLASPNSTRLTPSEIASLRAFHRHLDIDLERALEAEMKRRAADQPMD